MPVLSPDKMDAAQRTLHDEILARTGRVGRGPAIGYAYSPGLWKLHNAFSAHLLDCSLTPTQVRIVSLLTVRHWRAAYPWGAQSATAAAAGLDRAVIDAINAGGQPEFADESDEVVHAVARELLATGTLGDGIFQRAEATIGYRRIADIVGAIGHFCTTAMMANVAGAEPPADSPYQLMT